MLRYAVNMPFGEYLETLGKAQNEKHNTQQNLTL